MDRPRTMTSQESAPQTADEVTKRLRSKLDWTYGFLAWTGIAAPLAMILLDNSANDLVVLAASAIDSPLWEAAIYGLVGLALATELPVSAVAIALGARFPRRRLLLTLVLADLVVVMRYLVYPVIDGMFHASIVAYVLSRGPVLLYGVTCIAVCASWFGRGRRRFGTGDGGASDARSQFGDPFWPSSGPISRSQLDLAYGCFAWATFGWQLVLACTAALELAASYFLIYPLAGTCVVTAMTGLWLLLGVRRDLGLVALALLAFGLAVAVVSSLVVQQAELMALVARARTGRVSEGGIGLSVASLLATWLAWTPVAAMVVGPVLVIRWCCRTRLLRETFDPERDRHIWGTPEGARPPARVGRPPMIPVQEVSSPRVAAWVTFWWNIAALGAALAVFILVNAYTLGQMWIEFLNYGKDRPAAIGQFGPAVFFYVLALSYGLLLLVPPALTFPLAALTAWKWKRPPSILLLRAFHLGKASNALS